MLLDKRSLAACVCFITSLGFGQTISTIAGTGEPGSSGDGGPATAAQFSDPTSVGVDGAGNVYVLDSNNYRIRKVATNGIITTVVGNGETAPPVKGLATKTPFTPGDFLVTKNSVLYAVDPNGLYKIDQKGGLSLFAELNNGIMAQSLTGAMYSANISNVFRVGPSNAGRQVAGGEESDDHDGGPAMKAKFTVSGLAADIAGNIYIADNQVNRIRKFTPGGNITTLGGTGSPGFSGDGGPALKAQFSNPNGLAVDVAGNLYVADTSNNRIRRITPEGTITTFAGNGEQEPKGDGGLARDASFGTVYRLALDCGALYVSDTERIRKITLIDPLIAQKGVAVNGTRVNISGCNLASSSASAATGAPLPKSLAGTTVLINGTPAGLVSVSPGVVIAQLPAGLSGNVKMMVQTEGTTSNTAAVQISAR